MKQRFPIKKLEDGRALLNLGCGTRMNCQWNNVDFSYYAFLAHHTTLSHTLQRIGLLSLDRYQRLLGVDPQIIRHDLSKGIPFNNDTFDVVYHSHILEHIGRDDVHLFLRECYRVLKKGGILRVVVPDLQILVMNYSKSLLALETKNEFALVQHLKCIEDLFDQMVRKDPVGTNQQNSLVRFIESIIRGDTTKTGEAHQWMYDKFSLEGILSEAGFKEIQAESPSTSRISGWNYFCLDSDQDGTVYKSNSLYLEGVKK